VFLDCSADPVIGSTAMRSLMRTFSLSAAALALLVAGCSSYSSVKMVKGKVTYNGDPLGGADLEFVPKNDLSIGSFTSQTDPDGTFEVKLGKGTGRNARPGEFVALVTKGKAGGTGMPSPDVIGGLSEEERLKVLMKAGPGATAPSGSSGSQGLLPERYGSKASSPFKFTLSEGENDLGTLKLDGPPLKKK
jgi:hypothetical protein